MKLRESGMPDEAYWETLVDVPLILDRLGIDDLMGDVVELGCGYGTFTLRALPSTCCHQVSAASIPKRIRSRVS